MPRRASTPNEPPAGTAAGGALYVLVGSSGSGRTTLLREVVRARYPTLLAHHVDDLGVPSAEEIVRDHGSSEAFQEHQVRRWVRRTLDPGSAGRLLVIDGQSRPAVVRRVAEEEALTRSTVLLVDCGHAERRRRLLELRRQPELDVLDTYAWASYLRGQADALGIEVLDTTAQPLAASVAALAASLELAAARHGVALVVEPAPHSG